MPGGGSPYEGGIGSRVSLDCVVFTCGHHYQRQDLKHQVMSTWGTDMEALPVPLPITQKALQAMYTDEGDKTLPGACPRCIHSAILAYQKSNSVENNSEEHQRANGDLCIYYCVLVS